MNDNLRKRDIGNTKTFALGDCQWSIEVYTWDGVYIREFVGSNESWEEGKKVWEDYHKWYDSLPE